MELDLPADLWLPGRPPQIDDEVPAAALIAAMSVHGRRYCRRCDGAARDRRCKHRVKTVEASGGGSRQGTLVIIFGTLSFPTAPSSSANRADVRRRP